LNNSENIDLNKTSTLNVDSNKCTTGETFYDSNVGECRNCSTKCPSNAYIYKTCNGSHDTQCICKKGYFMAVDMSCKPCSQCESGWGKNFNQFITYWLKNVLI
jgi:hypothetical protein